MSSTQQQRHPQKKVQPKIIYKGQEVFRHDLYKAEVAQFKKNTSWKKGLVIIEPVEHCHFFHSHNSAGKPQTQTNSVGGHHHEIETYVDPVTGEMMAKCGPPVRVVYKRSVRGGVRKIIEPVTWESEDGIVKDEHTHVMRYIRSEELNPERGRQAAAVQAQALAQAISLNSSPLLSNKELGIEEL